MGGSMPYAQIIALTCYRVGEGRPLLGLDGCSLLTRLPQAPSGPSSCRMST